jgi:signal transduction histidine kinase
MSTVNDWQTLFRKFKEKLAQRLWAIPTVSESEKELVYKEYLTDLDSLEKGISDFHDDVESRERLAKEENDLLRSLLGVPGDELRTRTLSLQNELGTARKNIDDGESEIKSLTERLAQVSEENEFLRKRMVDYEKQSESDRLVHEKIRQDDIKFFSESHEGLKNELKDLETRLSNLRSLFTETNSQLLNDKQDEISRLQKKLLDDMEAALRRKQELSWAEEEMFAKGVAHRVRAALVSAQGQLFLTLERLGLLDPETRSEATWKARLKLLVEGGGALAENFRSLQKQFQDLTRTLDDYLHLTGRRQIASASVQLKDLVNDAMAGLYADRRPTLNVEIHSDDPLPTVQGDEELLRFVVNALLRNALEAIPNESGQIEITLRNMANKGQVQLIVKDSGRGVPENVQPRLFQPFMTTKEGRQGLSLSRARRYVDMHGGQLDVVQTGETGTTFKVELPIRRAVSAAEVA